MLIQQNVYLKKPTENYYKFDSYNTISYYDKTIKRIKLNNCIPTEICNVKYISQITKPNILKKYPICVVRINRLWYIIDGNTRFFYYMYTNVKYIKAYCVNKDMWQKGCKVLDGKEKPYNTTYKWDLLLKVCLHQAQINHQLFINEWRYKNDN